MNDNPSTRQGRVVGSFFWPILLIGIGVIWLLINLGVFTINPWFVLARFWPLFLVAIGLDILIGRGTSRGSALTSALLAVLVVGGVLGLLFLAQARPGIFQALAGPTGNVELQSKQVVEPRGGVQRAAVRINFPGGPGMLHAVADSTNLIEADLLYRGVLTSDISKIGEQAQINLRSSSTSFGLFLPEGEPRWDIGLNPAVEYEMTLNTGSGSYNLDLSAFKLRSLVIDTGSGRTEIKLPAQGQYHFQLDTGSGATAVQLPAGVAVRVEYEAGSGSFNAPNLRRVSSDGRDGVYETEGFNQNGPYVVIALDADSGAVVMQ